jgi:hypothetical protein
MYSAMSVFKGLRDVLRSCCAVELESALEPRVGRRWRLNPECEVGRRWRLTKAEDGDSLRVHRVYPGSGLAQVIGK